MTDAATIIPRLSETLTTFSPEAKAATLAKCAELGFEVNRAEIPIEESFINLGSAVRILRDAIERKKLNVHLPTLKRITPKESLTYATWLLHRRTMEDSA